MTPPLWLLLALLACQADLARPLPQGVGTLEVHPGPAGAYRLSIEAALARPDTSSDLVLMEYPTAEADPRLFLWRSSRPGEPAVPLDLDFDHRAHMWARDLDGDGYEELVMATKEGFSALRGPVTEDAAWEAALRRPSSSMYVNDLEILDLDGDGHRDWLIAFDAEQWSAVLVYRGPVEPGMEVEHEPDALLPAPCANGMTTALAFPGDLTGDGVDDLFLGPMGHGPAWLYPGPLALDGTDEPVVVFEAVEEYTDRGWAGVSAWTVADLSGDGQLDLVAAEGLRVNDTDLSFGGDLSAWHGPITGPGDVHTPDARILSPDLNEKWLPAALADLDGDGTPDPVLHSTEVGEVVYEGCGWTLIGGGLAWHPGGFTGEVPLEDEDVLFAATRETGRLGRSFNLGDMDGDGREELAVSMYELGLTWECITSADGGSGLSPSGDATGGFGILELP